MACFVDLELLSFLFTIMFLSSVVMLQYIQVVFFFCFILILGLVYYFLSNGLFVFNILFKILHFTSSLSRVSELLLLLLPHRHSGIIQV